MRMTLGVGDLGASAAAGDVLVTHALGSCVAVIVRDRNSQVCGLAHVVVPGNPPPSNAVQKPAYYAPTAISNLLDSVSRLGGRSSEILLVGGATVVDGLTSFDVGRRNVLAVRRALWARGIVPCAEDVEGTLSRTVNVEVSTGVVSVHNPTAGRWLLG